MAHEMPGMAFRRRTIRSRRALKMSTICVTLDWSPSRAACAATCEIALGQDVLCDMTVLIALIRSAGPAP
ncbi:hypothetical protein D3C81_2176160 [compost metagenome]